MTEFAPLITFASLSLAYVAVAVMFYLVGRSHGRLAELERIRDDMLKVTNLEGGLKPPAKQLSFIPPTRRPDKTPMRLSDGKPVGAIDNLVERAKDDQTKAGLKEVDRVGKIISGRLQV